MPLIHEKLDMIPLERFKDIVRHLVVIPALGLTKERFLEMLSKRFRYSYESRDRAANGEKIFKMDLTFFNTIRDYQHRVARCILEFNDRNNAATREKMKDSLLLRLICTSFSEILKECTIPTATYVFDALQVSSEQNMLRKDECADLPFSHVVQLQTTALYEGRRLPHYSGFYASMLCDLLEKRISQYKDGDRFPGALQEKYGKKCELCSLSLFRWLLVCALLVIRIHSPRVFRIFSPRVCIPDSLGFGMQRM